MYHDKSALDYYDFHARNYDAQLGRWNSPDILMEMYSSESPYSFTLNNPVNLTDPTGMYVQNDGCSGRRGKWDRGEYVTCGGGGGSSNGGSGGGNRSYGMGANDAINYLMKNTQYGGEWSDGRTTVFGSHSEAFAYGYLYMHKYDAFGKNGANSRVEAWREMGIKYHSGTGEISHLTGSNLSDIDMMIYRQAANLTTGVEYESYVESTTLMLGNVTVVGGRNGVNEWGTTSMKNIAAFTGLVAGMMEMNKVSNGMWYSQKTGKWYPVSNQPNGITGPRNPTLKSARVLHNYAKSAMWVGIIISTLDAGNYYFLQGGTGYGKLAWTGADITVGGISMYGGIYGMAIGVVYTFATTPLNLPPPSNYYSNPYSKWNTTARRDNL